MIGMGGEEGYTKRVGSKKTGRRSGGVLCIELPFCITASPPVIKILGAPSV